MKLRKLSLLVLMALFVAIAGNAQTGNPPGALTEGERLLLLGARLDALRQVLKIPGMSAAVVRDQQLIWAQGFGFADLEREVPATADTPYGLASVTRPVAAVLLM